MQATLAAIVGSGTAYATGCDGPTYIAAGGLGAITLRIALIDLKLRIIRDRDVIALTAIGTAWALWSGSDPALVLGTSVLRGLGYAAAFLAIRLGYIRLRGRDGLGFGDVKLVGAAGPLLAVNVFALAVAAAALGGIAFVLFRAVLKRRSPSRHTYVPFGFALAVAIFGAWITSIGL